MSTNTYVALDKQTLTGTATSVTFTGIDQTYTDLVLVATAARGITGSGSADFNITFNGDTGNNYSVTLLYESPASTRSSNRANLNWMGAVGDGNFLQSMVHIQNYSNSTTYKTALGRWGSPSDGIVRASVGLWRNTAAITSFTITPPNGIASGSTFTLYGIRAEGVSPAVKATGGAIYSDSEYYYHVFGSTGTFTPLQSLTADILCVAGGGGGGGARVSVHYAGGGGAGGVLAFANQSLSTTNYTVTVGAGGAGGAGSYPIAYNGTQGGNSQFGGLTNVIGGGYGATGANNGGNGGSGGGGGSYSATTSGGSATSGQGYAGGGSTANYFSGGGGGAGAVGATGTGTTGSGYGGNGVNTVTNWSSLAALASATGVGVNGYIAGGGQGSASIILTSALGGGGIAGADSGGSGGAPATPGVLGTGSGGGAGAPNGTQNGANGGSGVVIVRYLKA